MTITQRTYHSVTDLRAIGSLGSGAPTPRSPTGTPTASRAWVFWEQRRNAEIAVSSQLAWQQDIQLWEHNGDLIGAVGFESPTDAALIGDPAYPDLLPLMLDWAEARY
jgi:hypothetical protein